MFMPKRKLIVYVHVRGVVDCRNKKNVIIIMYFIQGSNKSILQHELIFK
jgi:hypothetical protein